MEKWPLFKKSVNDLTQSNYSTPEIKKKWSNIIRDFKDHPNHFKKST